ncbi:MAG TPA: D-alanyl-D-alanine carboxypeptidase [Firmicutes bacterium]|nr:D-alanyl-D-alanine carboxypeptidase [Bacillota bacterium]HBK61179.1 D-alanyl-D-alanine carboxypeptidase [Bacillota bacterium]
MSYKPARAARVLAVCALLVCALSARTVRASAAAAASPQAAAAAELARKVTAPSAILVEASTGRVLWEKNADAPRPIASVVKIMTLTLVMDAIEARRISLGDMVITSEHVASMGGSQIWLEPGEVMAVSDLMKAVAIESANDAAVALAEQVAGSEAAFVAMMNEKAGALGCANTHFVNATGLPEPGASDDCMSTARDVAIMSRELLRYPEIHQWLTIWIGYVRDGKNMLTNTNRLIRFYPGADGLKTGYTDKARYCLSATAVRNNVRVIGVVLGVPTSSVRFAEASTLLDYGFKMCEAHTLARAGQDLGLVRVVRGVETSVDVTMAHDLNVVTPRGEGGKIEARLALPPQLEAPIEQGQTVGKMVALLDGVEVAAADVIAVRAVPKASWLQLMVRHTRQFARSTFLFAPD